METASQIFLSYAREDRGRVSELYDDLSNAGFKPWMDTKNFLPGEDWDRAIKQAIRNSVFFLSCLSSHSVNKDGYFQKEVEYGLRIWKRKRRRDIYLIPVRLEDCKVRENLKVMQWVNLFESDGYMKLVKALETGIEHRPARITYGDEKASMTLQVYVGHETLKDRLRKWADGSGFTCVGESFEQLVFQRKETIPMFYSFEEVIAELKGNNPVTIRACVEMKDLKCLIVPGNQGHLTKVLQGLEAHLKGTANFV